MATKPMGERPEIRFHDQISAKWEDLHRGRVFQSRTASMFSLLDRAQLSGTTWLDAGCGTGTLSRMLARRGCNVKGVDASAQMILIAQKMLEAEPLATTCSFDEVGTIESMSFEKGTFDGILCASVLEYTNSPDRCLAEFSRILRPQGLLLLSIPNRHSMLRKAYRVAHAVSSAFLSRPAFRYLQFSRFEASLVEVKTLLASHGFTVVDHDFAGSPLPRIFDRNALLGTLINVLARREGNSD